MKTRLLMLMLGLLCLLDGCNLAPPYHSPAATLGVLPAIYKEGGIWQPATPADELPRGPWWKMYHDPLLNRLETQLIAANPNLAAALANYNVYRDTALELNAYLFPFVTANGLTASSATSMGPPAGTPYQMTYYGNNTAFAEVHYEVDLWDQIHNSVAAGVASAQAAAADLASAQLSMEAALASDYLTLRELDNDVRLLTDTVKVYQEYFVVVQERYQGKIASGLEVAQARFQVEAAQAQESGIRAQRAVYEHMIAALVGQPASAFSIPPKTMDISVPVIPTSVPAALLQRRPDIAAAERRVAAANAEIGVARAAFYPNLSLNSLVGSFASSGGAALSVPFSVWSIGPSLAMPLFEGGLLHAQLAKSVAQWREAVENYRAVVLRAFQEVEDGLSNVNLLSQEYARQRAAVKDAIDAEKMAFDLYMLGAKDYLEPLVDQARALAAEQKLIDIKEALLQSNVNLIRALGGGWSLDELPLRQNVLILTATNPRFAKYHPVPSS
jgi:NodT family efflux transporter outer membrane factor (OMF) lipoprotein